MLPSVKVLPFAAIWSQDLAPTGLVGVAEVDDVVFEALVLLDIVEVVELDIVIERLDVVFTLMVVDKLAKLKVLFAGFVID